MVSSEASLPPHATWREIGPRCTESASYRRFVIRTHLISPGERLERTLLPYLDGIVRRGDTLAISEKTVAIAEGRAVLLASIRPRRLARLLARHVRQLGHGIGFRRPETMEAALREAGALRILLAAAVAAVGRPLGRSGDFYRIAGRRIAAIDGPGLTTIPPYDRYVVLAPLQGEELCRRLSRRLRIGVAVVDVNDIGSEVLALSPGVKEADVRALLADNPMGQGAERTPLVVLRPEPGGKGRRQPDRYNGVARAHVPSRQIGPPGGGDSLPRRG